MKIVIANDHRGIEQKNNIVKYLNLKQVDTIDVGTNNNNSVDYPLSAEQAVKKILNKEVEFGILLCGTGIGMSIAANRFRGIRCAHVNNEVDVKLAREHNNANMIAMSSSLDFDLTKKIIDIFLSSDFSNENRHIKRNEMLDNYDN